MLYKRGKTWWIDFTAPNGERIRRSSGTTQKIQAQELHDRLKDQAWRQIKLGDRPRYTWDDAGVRWLEERSYKASINKDMEHLRWLQTYFRGKRLTDLNRTFIMDVLEIKRKETSAASANRVLALIRAILNMCVEWEWLESVPKLRQFPESKRRVRWITQEEAARLLMELPEHLRDMAHFSLATGLRQSNVSGLCWDQVDLARKVAWIHPDQSKNRKAIGISLSNTAGSILRRQMGKHQTHVFTYKGHPVTQVNTKAWRKALERAGIKDFRWHDLRHTWASWHVQAGTSINRLQEMGGWESIEMVRRYAHLTPEHLARDSAKIEGLLSSLVTNTPQPTLSLLKNNKQAID